MLAEVGKPFKLKTDAHCARAFAALATLHSGRVCHGDARLPNLLAVRGPSGRKALKWIDLRQSSLLRETESADFQCRRDLRTLAASILGCASSKLPAAVVAAIERYSAGSAADDVAAAVWAAKA